MYIQSRMSNTPDNTPVSHGFPMMSASSSMFGRNFPRFLKFDIVLISALFSLIMLVFACTMIVFHQESEVLTPMTNIVTMILTSWLSHMWRYLLDTNVNTNSPTTRAG
jgi:hypothetical protein